MGKSEPTTTNPPTQTMSPDELAELAQRLRGYASTIKNPREKAGMGADMRAAADVIDGLLKLYDDVRAGEGASVVEGVLKFIGGAHECAPGDLLPREQC